jgi:hypothetical protein
LIDVPVATLVRMEKCLGQHDMLIIRGKSVPYGLKLLLEMSEIKPHYC